MAETLPLPLIIRQLREVLRTTRYALMADVEPLVEQAFILLGFEDPTDPATQIQASDLAYTIAVILEHTQDNSIIRPCLGMLLKIGGIGEVLAATYLRKNRLPREALVSILDGFEPGAKLSLANRFFRHPSKQEPWFLQWAHELARSIQGEDPEETLLFLEAMPESEGGLSFPMQREFLRGRFGVWLHRLLHLELGEEQLAFLVRAARRLASHHVAMSLARSLERSQGQLLAELLECIGLCGRSRDPVLQEKILPHVRHADEAVALGALRALARLKSEKLPQVLAYAYTRREALRGGLLPLLLRMDAVGLRIFLERLPGVERAELLPQLVGLFARSNPDWLRAALQRQTAGERSGDLAWRQLGELLERFIAAHPVRPRTAAFRPCPPEGSCRAAGAPSPEEAAGLSLVERMKRGLGGKSAPAASGGDDKTVELLQRGGLVERLNLDNRDLSGLELAETQFSRCILTLSRLSGCSLRGVRFEKCTLRNLDLDGALLRDVEFLDCELVNCRLATTRLRDVRFTDCSILGGQFSASVLENLVLHNCRLLECDFSGAELTALVATGCQVLGTHFAHVTAREPRLQGVEFVDCRFHGTSLDRGVIRNSVASTSVFTDCSFFALDTDEPLFLAQERETALEGLAAAARAGEGAGRVRLPPQLGSAAGIKLMFRLVEQWFFEKDLKEREALFLANNRRRLDWALCMLPAPGDDFLRLLPVLLESDGELPDKSGLTPACALHGHVPDHSVRRLLERYKLPPTSGERSAALPLEGLYAIGSTGTIAHARYSDMDLWVCYDPARLRPEAVAALQAKLIRIEQWAARAFGLEVHFFLMDQASVRDNEFGYTDKESAGSSQAQLLKEEFYRTGLYLAGKKPLWWYLPPGLDAEGYQRQQRRFREAVGPLDRSVLDLGHQGEIPRSEFFGASLWQIVKAIKSPFKSAMKLALLDKYTHGDDSGVLLCNRLKQNVFNGGRDLWDIDPYALMFREVFEYYAAAENREAQDLMRLAFLQKTGLYLAAQSTGRFYEMQDYSFMEFFFPYSEADIASHVEPGRGVPTEEVKVASGFAEHVELGQMLVRFMLGTYETIHRAMAEHEAEMHVTEEDRTRLGRKIFSYLSPRPDKIMRIPFMEAGRNLFASLEFTCTGGIGAPAVWQVSGEAPKRGGRRGRKELLKSGDSLEPLLVWLVANGIYTPDMPLQGVSLEYPVALGDIAALLQALHAFFPPDRTFDTDIDEYLRREEAQRVLLLVNVMVPREERALRRVTMVHSTNWGELFCRPATKDLETLRKHPLQFVRGNLDKGLHRDLELEAFLPPKAQCPPVRLY